MSKKDYVPVGGIMTRKNGKKYQVSSYSRGCTYCAFGGKTEQFCEDIPCNAEQREDGETIIYIRRKDLELLQSQEKETVCSVEKTV